jgi:mannosyltransferase
MSIPSPAQVVEQSDTNSRSQLFATSRDEFFVVGAITALATLARLLFLGKSFWLDEGISISLVRSLHGNASALPSFIGLLCHAGELNMAPYYVLLRQWMHLGESPWFIRLLSVLPGTATVPIVYVLGKRIFSSQAGLAAALLLAIHGAHVAYSQEARGYALCVFLCCLSYLAFLKTAEAPAAQGPSAKRAWSGWSYWFFYSVLVALAIYSHFYAVLIIPAQLIALFWLPRGSLRWRPIVLSAMLLVLLVSPAASFVLTQNSGQLGWIESTAKQLPRLMGTLAGNRVVFPLYLVLWVMAIRTGKQPWSHRSFQAWRYALVGSWLCVPVVLVLLGCLKKPILQDRYLLICVPAAALLAAQGLVELRGSWRRPILLVTLVLSLVGVAYTYYVPKEDWQGAAEYIFQQARSGDAVTIAPARFHAPFDYYWSRRPPSGVSYELLEDSNQMDSWIWSNAGHDRIFVVLYTRSHTTFPEVTALRLALQQQYTLEQRRDLKFVSVETYRRKAH